MSEQSREPAPYRLGFSPRQRERVQRVGLIYDHPGLSHSVLVFADSLPSVFSAFPNATVEVYNHGENNTNLAALYRPPPGRTLVVKRQSFHRELDRWIGLPIGDETVAMFFERLTVSRTLLPAAAGLTLHLHAFGAPGETARVDLYRGGNPDPERLELPVTGNVQERQAGVFEHLGIPGFAARREDSVLDRNRYSEALSARLESLLEGHPELREGRRLVFANLLKSMRGDWTYEGETPHSVKERWVAALELLVRQLDVDLMINPGPREWRRRGWFPAGAGAPVSENWERLSGREELGRLSRHLRKLPGCRARILGLDGDCGVLELAALLDRVKETGGALVDVHTGSTHLAEWMAIPEVVEHNPVLAFFLPSRPTLLRVDAGRPGSAGAEEFGWRVVDGVAAMIDG